MSARALVISQNDEIKFAKAKNPKGKGTLMFACGSVRGYVSPQVEANLATATIDDLQVAECSIDNGQTFVPCLMMQGLSNVVARLGGNLLR